MEEKLEEMEKKQKIPSTTDHWGTKLNKETNSGIRRTKKAPSVLRNNWSLRVGQTNQQRFATRAEEPTIYPNKNK